MINPYIALSLFSFHNSHFFYIDLSTHLMSSCEGPLAVLFPGNLTDAPWARAPLDSTSSIIQLLPLALTLAFWGYIEVQSRRLSFTRAARQQSDFVGILALLVSTLLLWRVFDLMRCVEPDSSLSGWRTPVVLGGLAVGGLVFTNGYRFPRLAIFLALLGAGAAFFADWALRGGIADLLQISNATDLPWTPLPAAAAAVPLAAVQQLWCLFAVTLFARLPSRVAHCPKKDPVRFCACFPCPAPRATAGGGGVLGKDPETGAAVSTFAMPDALDRRREPDSPLPPRSWFT